MGESATGHPGESVKSAKQLELPGPMPIFHNIRELETCFKFCKILDINSLRALALPSSGFVMGLLLWPVVGSVSLKICSSSRVLAVFI